MAYVLLVSGHLILTLVQLCDLLEGDLAGKAEIRRNSTSAELITFETFLTSYWGHFSETIRKGLGNVFWLIGVSAS